ncbi:MAG TPA: hypothetical protein VF389_07935, partial [Woeseiaceae bacterium]
SSATWTAGNGKQVELVIFRNARLAQNGWLQAATHEVQIWIGGHLYSMIGTEIHPQAGYVLNLMGKISVRVPEDQQGAVKAMIAEAREHNAAAHAAADKDEAEYQAHRAGVLAMLNK